MCGWLLPGPVSLTPDPPRETAIWAAVSALPYRFDASLCTCAWAVPFVDGHVAADGVPPVGSQVVHFVEVVELSGFMPATAGLALPFCCTTPFDAVFELAWVELDDVASCFACPGATWSEGAAETDASACASTWAAG